MALSPKIKPCFKHNCTNLYLYDITGAYNASTNTTGWGSPNTTLAGATIATVSITLPEATSAVDFDVLATVNAATIVDGEFTLDQLTMEDFDSTEEKFPDGVYTIVYTIDETYTQTITTFSTCQTDCCVEKMKTKFAEKLCGCDWDIYWKNYLEAKAYLTGAKYKYACGDTTNAIAMLKKVQKICATQNCCC